MSSFKISKKTRYSKEFGEKISRRLAGNKWYNDGIKNYLMKSDDPKIIELNLVKGFLSVKNNKIK